MPILDEISGWLAARLPELLAEHQVPGAAIGVYADGQVIEHACGVLSTATGVEATVDSVFQIGSITKTWTATLIMQLADEGLLDIDAPVTRYLPDFRLADDEASRVMTIRQVLCHTAGFEGDIFTDTGAGDDCVEKYVATLATDPQLFAPGEMFSYNNAGFCVLGRVVEVLRGKPYDQCLRDHLFAPLGLTHVATDASSAIMFRAAVGHLQPNPEEPPAPAPVWALVRSNAPAGHDGGTIGQSGFLRFVPGKDVAIALLTNGGNPIAVYHEIFGRLLRELAEVEMPAWPVPPANPERIDASRYVGTYTNEVSETTVSQDADGRIWMDQVPRGIIAELVENTERTELVHLHGDTLIALESKYGIHPPKVRGCGSRSGAWGSSLSPCSCSSRRRS